jgi:serine/threonine-protein kinase
VDDARRRRVDELLAEMLALSVSEQDSFLEQACGDDLDLAQDVRRAMQAGTADDEFLQPRGGLEAPLWSQLLTDLSAEQAARGGDQVGPYRIIREIGRGGMGIVYLAQLIDRPGEPPVALKVLSGSHDDSVMHRFELERHILATLDHPGIARHIEGGVTAAGNPYFAMEYVDGQPIDKLCDDKRLGIEDRLRLFIDVARAVQHAHRSMVVHRDLKPSNILVTQGNQIKLLDFGIAKLLDHGAGVAPVPLTRTGLLVLTPEYASPEQIRGRPITTASDVYQLGVVLFELLTGQRPYRISGHTSAEIERVICEQDIVPPSMAVSRRSEAGEPTDSGSRSLAEVSAARSIRPERLAAKLKGELDTIVMKALHKEPERRYLSADELSRDIERFLHGRPISARKDSVVYQAWKFVRRHPLGIGACLMIFVLAAALIGFSIERQLSAHRRALREAQESAQVATFLEGLFDVAEPGLGVAAGESISAKELLDRGTARVARDLDLQPQLQATLQTLLGDMYRKLGSYEQAEPLLEQALATRTQVLGDSHPEVAASLHALGRLHTDTGSFDRAESLFKQALAGQRAALGDGAEVAQTLVSMAGLYVAEGKLEEAEPLYRQALQILEEKPGGSDQEIARGLTGLSSLYWSQGRYDEAEPLLLRALQIHESAATRNSREMAIVLSDLGQLYARKSQFDKGERLLRDGHATLEEVLGDDHPSTAMSLMALARLLAEQNRYDEAERLLRQALTTLQNAYDNNHPVVGECLNELALLSWSRGSFDEAEIFLRQALAIGERTLGPGHPDIAAGSNSLGALYVSQGRFADAEEVFRRALEILEESLAPDHPFAAVVRVNLADVLGAQGEHAEAIGLCRRAVLINDQALGAEHPDAAHSRRVLANLYAECGRYTEAEELLQQALSVQEQALGPAHTSVASVLSGLCAVHKSLGRYDQALQSCERALEIDQEILGGEHVDVADDMIRLATVYSLQGRHDRAEPMLRQALTAMEQALGPQSLDLIPLLNQLAVVCAEQSRPAQAGELLQRALSLVPAGRAGVAPDQLFNVADTYLILGQLEASRGDSHRARQHWQEALTITEANLQDACVVWWRRCHALALLYLERTDEAAPLVESLVATGYRNPALERARDNL